MSCPRVLLVNPAIHDFAAYDFWLKPYGLLSVAGELRGQADFACFDYLDRLHPFLLDRSELRPDRWGRGRFYCERIDPPACLRSIPRYFRRFGLPRDFFRRFLCERGPFDHVWIESGMTYWYLGVAEVIEDVRRTWPDARIVLGGNYATLCPDHARDLGADVVVEGTDLQPLWDLLGMTPDSEQPALWESYSVLKVGVLKLTEGCPFNCTYCSVPQVYGSFKSRSRQRSLAELDLLTARGVRDIAFYDDALLFEAQTVIVPFIEELMRRGAPLNLHTPNALNARFVTSEMAELMVRAGFKTFYLGFESCSRRWQHDTGGKVYSEEFAQAVRHLLAAGAEPVNVTAYQILGHPHGDVQELEDSMRFVHHLGVRGMLADFSPIPGTVDGEACRVWADLDEPLLHNNTAFPILHLGFDEVNRLKDLQRRLNRNVGRTAPI
ncbi:MAG: radical SAM protein [Sedimentisphaerales bacterium]|nr:radical SAM protein [Sedimentisphaerales bacterium]